MVHAYLLRAENLIQGSSKQRKHEIEYVRAKSSAIMGSLEEAALRFKLIR